MKITKGDNSTVKFTIVIDEETLAKANKATLQSLKQNVKIKGFRPGKAPDDMVMASVGIERFAQESFDRAINKAYQSALKENDIKPIANPKVDVKHDKKPIEAEIEVEVFPEVEVGDYKKIEVKCEKAKVGKKEVDAFVLDLLKRMNVGRKAAKRMAKKDDMLVVSFEGFDEKGEVIPSTKGEKVDFILGAGQFLPDLEKAFEGMKPGEKKEAVPVEFPKTYHQTNFAGKTIPFNIELEEVASFALKNCTPEELKTITGRDVSAEDFENEMKEYLTLQEEQKKRDEAIINWQESLGKITKTQMPASWIDAEVVARMADLKKSPQFAADEKKFWAQMGKTEKAVEKEFKDQATKNLTIFLGLSKVVETEAITLDKDEENEVNGTKNPEYSATNKKIEKFLQGLFPLEEKEKSK